MRPFPFAAIPLLVLTGCHQTPQPPAAQPVTPGTVVANALTAAAAGDWATLVAYVDSSALVGVKAQFMALAAMAQAAHIKVFTQPDSAPSEAAVFFFRAARSFAAGGPLVVLLGDSLPVLRDLPPPLFSARFLSRMDSLGRATSSQPRAARVLKSADIRDSTAEFTAGPGSSPFDRLRLIKRRDRWYLDDSFMPFFIAFIGGH
jgi:hypothetical protein